MNEATNGSAGWATRSAGVPVWRSLPSTMTPTWSARAAASSKSWVTSSVGIFEPGQKLLQLGSHVGLRMGVECRQRLVEQQDLGVACECPGEGDSLTLAAREAARAAVLQMRDLEAIEVLVGRPAPGVFDVLADGQVREERVVLEDEPDPASLGRHGNAALGVEPGFAVAGDPAGVRLDEAGDRVEDGAFTGTGRADERRRLVDGEAQLEPESPKRDGDLLEGERCHESPILGVSSRTALIRMSTPLIASVASKFRSNSA